MILQLWHFTRRWAWLFLLAALLTSGSAYLVSIRLQPVYEGTLKLLVTPGQSSTGVASYNDVLTAERLTGTYAEVLKTRPVIEAAVKQAGLGLSYEGALSVLDVKPVRGTQLIQVSARASDPELAANFANQVAASFISQMQASQTSRFSASLDSLRQQADQLAADIADRSNQIDTLRSQPASATRDGEMARVQGELTQLQQSYAAAVRAYEDVRVGEARGSDLLSVVDPASASSVPVQPRILLNVILAAVLGLLIGIALSYVLDRLDDRLRTPERVANFTGLLPLGLVGAFPKNGARGIMPVLAPVDSAAPTPTDGYSEYGGSQVTESFRLLRANIQFAAVDNPTRSLLITSSQAGDGKTTTASYLSVVLAQAGQKVVLVDADLRRPNLHTLFSVPNKIGLTTLLVDERQSAEATLVDTQIAGLRLLPSGFLPPNPSELLASQRMRRRLEELVALADIVILDSPPVLPVSDPAVLAGLVDNTLLVVNARHTRAQHAVQAVATLQRAGAHVLGVVLNQLPPSGGSYYAGGYYAAYEPRPAAANQPSP